MAGRFWAIPLRIFLGNIIIIRKQVLQPDRLRHIPRTFSWIDHRLIRQHRLRSCGPNAWALYLFLVCAADVQGLSYYSDASIARYLNCDITSLSAARQQLIEADLIAFTKPLYQVLALSEPLPLPPSPRTGQVRSVGEILRQVLEGGQG